MKKNLLTVFLMLFIYHSLFSQVINYTSDTVEKLYVEYVEEGFIPPFFFGPLLAGEVNRASEKIDSPYYIQKENKNGASFSTAIAVAGHLFSQEEAIETVHAGSANNGIDYTKNYLEMPPFLGIGFEFSNEAGFGGGLYSEIFKPFTNNYFENINISLSSVDKNFMQEGYIYYDNPNLSLLIGRMNTQMGLLYSDNIFFNNNIPYTDSIRLYLPFGSFFNYYWQITNIPSVRSMYQKDIETGNTIEKNASDYYYGFEDDDFPSVILNTYQRFGFQSDFLRLGLALNVFLVRRNNRFEFVDFFPFSDWHASDVISNNMSMGVDAFFVPKKNLLIGFQLGFDEINANAIGLGDTDTPTIWSLIGTM